MIIPNATAGIVHPTVRDCQARDGDSIRPRDVKNATRGVAVHGEIARTRSEDFHAVGDE